MSGADLPVPEASGGPEADAELDDKVLALRSQSKGFSKIAVALGLSRAADANDAFNRALRRRPAPEQVTIRAAENRRLDKLAAALGPGGERTQEDVDRRLKAIARLRTRLMAE